MLTTVRGSQRKSSVTKRKTVDTMCGHQLSLTALLTKFDFTTDENISREAAKRIHCSDDFFCFFLL